MENLNIIVGTEECPIRMIWSVFLKDGKVKKDWSVLATGLGVPNATIKSLKQEMLLNKMNLSDLINEILDGWVEKSVGDATLGKLLRVVEEQLEANNAGECLRLTFNIQCKAADNNLSIKWNELSPPFQKRVEENLKKFFPTVEFGQVLPKLEGPVLIRLMTGKIPELFNYTLPEKPSYYINRTLITRNIMSNEIFDDDSTDIFLFTGMDRSELSRLVKFKLTSGTREQLEHRSSPTVNFMILEQANHFDKICERSSHPVHLLRRESDRRKLKWIKSKGSMTRIQKYVDKSQDELDEEAFCGKLDPQTTFVCISDSPGMGKSYLLGQIGRSLKQQDPHKTVFFIVISEFMKLVRENGPEDMAGAIENALQITFCKNPVAEAVLGSLLKVDRRNVISLELLFDGFDEINSEDNGLALEMLLTIQKSFKFARVWITSRLHLLGDLENKLSLLGHNIKAFQTEDQINFLSSVWSLEDEMELNETKLREFAQHCLHSLKATMSSTEEDIAGIPLQCSLIGQIYQDDAIGYAQGSDGNANERSTCEVEVATIPELYGLLINKKFQKCQSTFGIGELKLEKMMDMHVHLGLQLIFPDSLNQLEGFLSPVDLEEVLKVGILECSSTTDAPRFVHRTFAEYFIAWMLTDRLRKEEDMIWNEQLNNFLFEEALLCKTIRFNSYRSYRRERYNVDSGMGKISFEFSHPVISYFINYFFADFQLQPHTWFPFPPNELSSTEWLKEIAHACVWMNHLHIFKWFDGLGAFGKDAANLFIEELLLLAIQPTCLELFRIVLAHFEEHHALDLKIQKRLIEMAVRSGSFSILEFLLKEKELTKIVVEGSDDDDMMNLVVYECLSNSVNDSDGKIERKKLILRMLVGMNPSLLEPKKYGCRQPLTAYDAHPRLPIELVRLGADVLMPNEKGNTVLHYNFHNSAWTKEDYHELLMSISEEKLAKLVHISGLSVDTPLMSVVRNIDPLPETLKLFKNVGVQFHSPDWEGETVLTVAVKERRSSEVIRKLIQIGAIDVGWKSKGTGCNILHITGAYGNIKALELFVDEFGMDVNCEDSEGLTPLDYAIKHDNKFEVGLALHGRGGMFMEYCLNSYDDDDQRYSPEITRLHHATRYHHFQSIRLLTHFGLSANQVDDHGNTPLHFMFLKSHCFNKFYYTSRLLLDNNARLDLLNNEGDTPFDIAFRSNTLTFRAFRLLKSQAKIMWTPDLASVALHCIVRAKMDGDDQDFLELFHELVDQHKADVNHIDEEGNSLLHSAANGPKAGDVFIEIDEDNQKDLEESRRYPLDGELKLAKMTGLLQLNMIKLLIELGTNVHARNGNGETFFDSYARQHGLRDKFHQLVEFMIEQNLSQLFHTNGSSFKNATPLHLAVLKIGEEPLKETLSLLHSCHVDFNAVDNNGDSVLAYAIEEYRSVEFMSILIEEFGADPNHRNKDGWSMLHHAARWFHLNALKYFLDLGGLDVNERGSDGNTPLHVALIGFQFPNSLPICRLLIERGSDLNIINEEGLTPLGVLRKMNTLRVEKGRVDYRTSYPAEWDEMTRMLSPPNP